MWFRLAFLICLFEFLPFPASAQISNEPSIAPLKQYHDVGILDIDAI